MIQSFTTYGFLLLQACLLVACSTSSETFECKVSPGVGCRSIIEVNQMVDQRILGKEDPAPVSEISSLVISDFNTGIIQREQEQSLRVWIAPFEDDQGNLHEGSVVHTILRPGFWHIRGA